MSSNDPSSVVPAQRSFGRKCLRWFGRFLIGVAVLATLLAIFFAEEGWRGKRAWENYRREAEARGAVLDYTKFTPPPVPDEQNFAMTPFLAPLFDMNPDPLQPGQTRWRDTNAYNRIINFADKFLTAASSEGVNETGKLKNFNVLLNHLNDPDWKKHTNAVLHPQLSRKAAAEGVLANLEQYQPVINELREAAKRPYSRFNVKYEVEDTASILLPHLGALKRLSQYINQHGCAELAVGNPDAAFEDLQLAIHLCDASKDEPFIITTLVRVACYNIMVNEIIREGLATHQWNDAQLLWMQEYFSGLNAIKEANYTLGGERAGFGVAFYEYMRKHPSVITSVMNGGDAGANTWQFGVFNFVPSGWFYMEQINQQKWYDRFAKGVSPDFSRVYPKVLDQVSNFETNKANPFVHAVIRHDVFVTLLTPALDKFIIKAARCQTLFDELDVACALERNRLAGNPLPEKLDSLVPKFLKKVPLDVVGSEPLKYRPLDKTHFLLYGVGWNETDDNGEIAATGGHSPGQDLTHGDWVWPAYPEAEGN